MSNKYVYTFGGGKGEGDTSMKNLLGGKGANLAEMSGLGIPVPAGMTVTTEVCTHYYDNNHNYPGELEKQVEAGVHHIERVMGAKFGDPKNPLLLSVRSGARVSMPGMMDTVLNLGLTSQTLDGLVEKTGNKRFVYDCYRRFIQMYSGVVMGAESEHFEKIIDEMKTEKGVTLDTDLTVDDLKTLCDLFKARVKEDLGVDFPDNVNDQLWGGISAVFKSWNTERAVEYRRIHGYADNWGTAVNIQSMVFGNMGNDCATGVAFTRDPSTGENRFYGEYLVNAQGEDVVAGIRTPQPINIVGKKDDDEKSLEEIMPDLYNELEGIYKKLEDHYKDMQDIEFTIQQDKLWMLQTRNGKRTAQAAVAIAVDMVEEGLIDKDTAVMRVEPEQLDQLLHPMIDPNVKREAIAKGLPASPGAAVGKVYFTAEEAHAASKGGEKVVLVRLETSPDDIKGMVVAEGILTARGGMTSHAAVVARGMGTCCVAGCQVLQVDSDAKIASIGDITINEGDPLTLDGSTGEVMLGELPTTRPELTGQFGQFMEWVDAVRTIKVRANADTPHDSEVARKFGAEGIGLCRTEHMFFEGERIDAVREMILADDLAGRKKALTKILPMQKSDFKGIFRVMNGHPVTVRLLDPPLHEFIPHTDAEINELAQKMDVPAEKLKAKAEELHEFNPMLGHRGCRLGVTYPEIYAMQTQAIMEAACELVRDEHLIVIPEIEIPLVGHLNELRQMRAVCEKIANEVMERTEQKIKYFIGTMIELPRAAVTADEIAKAADFFSFGTNDLTQTTFGFSRDDAGKFINEYVEKKILPADPFVTIDQNGVGKLMKIAVELGRKTKKNLEIGICGEHGGEAKSVEFCHNIGLNYVSCSPYRVPIARLAAAQAAMADEAKQ
ncbi:MAG: pyruvate, phosphate dikinase [Deltaproteobacteria bacterium]|nr:pyruvate, phosphate dikinase [Deltaproteobacteria bacterium]